MTHRNMKKLAQGVALAGALAAAAGFAAPALATVVDFGNFTLGATDTVDVGTINLLAAPSYLTVAFNFDFNGHFDDSYASDLQVVITDPNSNTFTIGGYDNEPSADTDWTFQGSVSNAAGFYSNSFPSILFPGGFGTTAGAYDVTITDDWSLDPNSNNYNNFTVSDVLQATSPNPNAVPEPGMAAIMGLGLAGLGLARRRRRARKDA